VFALARRGPALLAGGAFQNAGGQPRAHAAALDTASGLATPWNPAPNNWIQALAVTDSSEFAAGFFASAGGQPRPYLAELDTLAGGATGWDAAVNGGVLTLAAGGGALIAGGSFTTVGLRHCGGLARLLPPDATPPQAQLLAPNGGESFASGQSCPIRWSASDAQGVRSVDLLLSRSGPGGPWEVLGAGVPNTGSYTWVVTGAPAAASAYVRVDARDPAGNVGSDASDAPFTLGEWAAVPPPAPAALALAAAPDPAAGRTRCSFELPARGPARLELLDVQGRALARLADGVLAAGPHAYELDVRALRPGLYFLRLRAPGGERLRRLAVVR